MSMQSESGILAIAREGLAACKAVVSAYDDGEWVGDDVGDTRDLDAAVELARAVIAKE